MGKIRIYKYTQFWCKYRGAGSYMFRFYLPRTELTDLSTLSPASRKAWEACDSAFRSLSDMEKRIVWSYYSESYDQKHKGDSVRRVSEMFGVGVNDVKRILDRAIRTVVIERGLADE